MSGPRRGPASPDAPGQGSTERPDPVELPAPRPSGRGGARRTHRAPRCNGCGLHVPLCVCADVVPRPTRSRVVVVTLPVEARKTTSSARLLLRALPACDVRLRGAAGAPTPLDDLAAPARRPVLLYPMPGVPVLDAAWVASDPRPVTLVVPDGNWRQARRLVRPREPVLSALPKVRLLPGPPSRFELRSHPDPARLSTFEAVARALEVLEGPEAGPPLRAALERTFEAWVDRALFARGRGRRFGESGPRPHDEDEGHDDGP